MPLHSEPICRFPRQIPWSIRPSSTAWAAKSWAATRAAGGDPEQGHGHGISRNRVPKDNPSLPHEPERDDKQPYAREVEDYSGGGVTRSPQEQAEREPPKP